MELQLQKQPAKFKPKSKVGAAGNKFVGVRQRPSGRWVAEIKDTTQKIRMWLGTFETAEDAARAYDEAACLLRGANTRTNFSARRPAATAADSPLAARIRKLLHSKKAAAGGHSGGVSTAAGDSAGGSPASSLASSQDVCFAGDLAAESTSCSSWAFDVMLDGFGLSEGVDLASESSPAAEVSEFERMKVERQISASLYAMNGVQEYFEAVQDLSSSPSMLIDPVWDLPPLYHFY